MDPTQTFQISPLGGLDERWKGAPGSADTMQDLAWDPHGGWRTAGGYRRLILGASNGSGGYTNPFTGHGKVTSLHWFAQGSGGRQWLIYEATFGASSTTLCALNPSDRSGTVYDIIADRDSNDMTGRLYSPTTRPATQSATWRDRIYLVNGVDRPVVFDGRRGDQAGFDTAPSPPQATEVMQTTATYYSKSGATDGTQINGIGLGPVPLLTTDSSGATTVTPYKCSYRYRVAFLNARGQQSPPSVGSSPATFQNGSTSSIAHGSNFLRVQIPTGGSNCVARVVFRTQNTLDTEGNPIAGMADTFYFHSFIPDNATKEFEDHLPDDALGNELDETAFGPWPPGASIIAAFKQRIFLAVGSTLYFSYPGFPEIFPVNNYLDFGDDHLGPITAMYASRNVLVVFKSRGIYLVTDDGTTVERENLTYETGCIAPDSVCQIPNVGLCFLSDTGIWMLEGTLQNEGVPTKVVHLSTPMPETIEKLNRAALSGACATVLPREREAWFAVPFTGFDRNSHVLVYHYDVREWSIRPYYPISCMVTTEDHRGYLIFGSWADNTSTSPDGLAHEGLFVYSRGWDDKDGTAITPVYVSAPADFGYLYRNVSVAYVNVWCVGYGDTGLVLDYCVNRDVAFIRATTGDGNLSQDQQYRDDNHAMSIYGTSVGADHAAVWDQTVWGDWRPIVLRYAVSTAGYNPAQEFQFKLTPESGTRHMELIAVGIDVKVGEQRKIRPITDLGG